MTVVKIVNERSLQKYIATFVVEIVFLIVRAYSSKGDEMLGGSFFEEDPFFAGHRQQMQQMQQLMNPFPTMHHHNMLEAAPVHPHVRRHQQRRNTRENQMVPFGMFGAADFGFGDMFRNMRKMMDDMHRSFGQPAVATPNSHMFTQSSYVQFSNNGQGQAPQVYQATSSTRQAPGGVKETRRTVRDTESGVEKIAIGHHINDRAHIIERSQNRHTGDRNENQEYINLEEEEAPTFDREWQEKTRHMARGMDHRRARHNPIGNVRTGRQMAALPEPRPRIRRDRE
ncbi:myeloid leukemia factor 2-like [Haliotis rufescens]|uniref:myeloid leukemia factor 2-like n=1 Tax=Haliotis rufescens TaxID=6454 RepID=UPI001EAF91BA|nr:myeloid leukemia factor 2-like [Haliotis rufescens]